MKTPKRHHELTTMEHISTERVWDYSQEQVNTQRWKRKNRIKQLKRSLHRYKHGSNLGFYCHEWHAYKLMQELEKPCVNADVNKWNFYTQRLLDIQSHLMQAIAQSSREAGACWEREEQNRRDAQKLFQEKLDEHMRKEQE